MLTGSVQHLVSPGGFLLRLIAKGTSSTEKELSLPGVNSDAMDYWSATRRDWTIFSFRLFHQRHPSCEYFPSRFQAVDVHARGEAGGVESDLMRASGDVTIR